MVSKGSLAKMINEEKSCSGKQKQMSITNRSESKEKTWTIMKEIGDRFKS